MARTQLTVELSHELLARLDLEAERRNVSRSSLIEEAVAEYLDRIDHLVAVARYADGYRKIPPDTPDAWGTLESKPADADSTAQQLDADADQAGVEW